MRHIVGGVVALALALPVLWAADDPKDKPGTPEEQIKALIQEHKEAVDAYRKAVREAKTAEERQKVAEEKAPKPEKYAARFLELAEKAPKTPAAAEALVWVATNAAGPAGKDNPQAKARALLRRDHLESDKLGPLCSSLSRSLDKDAEALLRAVLDKNPHKEVQGLACMALADYLKNRTETVARLREQPDLARFYEGRLDKDYLKELQALDADKIAKEVEGLFERAAEKYADVKLPFRGTVGERAKSELFEIRFLAVGKAAPEIAGEDVDAQKFKLSDYRGKVVMLDFWGHW